MKKIGWEIQPLGWLLLIIRVVVSYYLIATWVRRPLFVSKKEA